MLEQILLSGLAVGAIYALIAIGFTVVFSTMRIVNFAHGEFVMAGGMLYAYLHGAAGLSIVASVAASIAVCAAGAWLVYEFGLRSIAADNHIPQVMMTLGVGIAIKGLVQVYIGKDTVFPPAFSGAGPVVLNAAIIPAQSLWVAGALVAFVVALHLLRHRTRLGMAMRAVSINQYAAQLMGISPRQAAAACFVIAGALGAAAGALFAPLASMHYDNGIFLGIKGFAAAVLGGIGNPIGAVLGGLILGVSEAVAAGYLSSVYKDAVSLLLLLAVLLVRPQGLVGDKLIHKL